MAELINLRQRRKAKMRAEAEAKAAQNRHLHGRTLAEKRAAKDEAVRLEKHVEAHRRDTLKAWDEFQATGKHATAEEVDKWLASWGTENELPAPDCEK